MYQWWFLFLHAPVLLDSMNDRCERDHLQCYITILSPYFIIQLLLVFHLSQGQFMSKSYFYFKSHCPEAMWGPIQASRFPVTTSLVSAAAAVLLPARCHTFVTFCSEMTGTSLDTCVSVFVHVSHARSEWSHPSCCIWMLCITHTSEYVLMHMLPATQPHILLWGSDYEKWRICVYKYMRMITLNGV